MTGGSVQLRRFRIAVRDGLSIETAAANAGFTHEEARLTWEADQADPPPPESYLPIGKPTEHEIMARKAKAGDGQQTSTNLTETKQTIRDAVNKILRLKSERKELNAAIGEQRARVKNCGVPPAALDLAIKMKEADQEDRQAHDEGYAIARDALGLGLQLSMFEDMSRNDDSDGGDDCEDEEFEASPDEIAGQKVRVDAAAKRQVQAGLSGAQLPDALN